MCKIKLKNGFTYIDVVVAMAIFSIAAMAVFAVLSQSFNNMNIARERHEAHLSAQSIMLIARDSVNPDLSDFNNYTVWIIGDNIIYITDKDNPGHVPDVNIISPLAYGTMIIVIVWDANGNIAARAKGMTFR